MSSGGEHDATTRPYRSGDDRRLVHWRTTARTGELAVRREEQPWQTQATILIDTRMQAHSPGTPSASFEYSVSVVASIVNALIRSGYGVRLVDDVARILGQSQLSTGDAGFAIMEALADLHPSSTPSLLPVASRIGEGAPGHFGGEQSGAVIAVLGRLTPGDTAAVARAAAGSTRCLGILIDAEAFAGAAGRAAVLPSPGVLTARDALRTAGWSVAIAGPGSPIDELWRQVNAATVDMQRRRWVG
jgi:uncharacterized protein (DUF58 family)